MRLALNQCILVLKKPSVAQPHVLSRVCGVYVSYECEAAMALNHCILVLKKPSVAQPHILSQICGVYVSYECEASFESCILDRKSVV